MVCTQITPASYSPDLTSKNFQVSHWWPVIRNKKIWQEVPFLPPNTNATRLKSIAFCASVFLAVKWEQYLLSEWEHKQLSNGGAQYSFNQLLSGWSVAFWRWVLEKNSNVDVSNASDWTKHRSFQCEASVHLALLLCHFSFESSHKLEVGQSGYWARLSWASHLGWLSSSGVPYQRSDEWGKNECSVVVSLGPALIWNWEPHRPLLAQASCSITSSLILAHEHNSLQILYVFRWGTTK